MLSQPQTYTVLKITTVNSFVLVDVYFIDGVFGPMLGMAAVVLYT